MLWEKRHVAGRMNGAPEDESYFFVFLCTIDAVARGHHVCTMKECANTSEQQSNSLKSLQ